MECVLEHVGLQAPWTRRRSRRQSPVRPRCIAANSKFCYELVLRGGFATLPAIKSSSGLQVAEESRWNRPLDRVQTLQRKSELKSALSTSGSAWPEFLERHCLRSRYRGASVSHTMTSRRLSFFTARMCSVDSSSSAAFQPHTPFRSMVVERTRGREPAAGESSTGEPARSSLLCLEGSPHPQAVNQSINRHVPIAACQHCWLAYPLHSPLKLGLSYELGLEKLESNKDCCETRVFHFFEEQRHARKDHSNVKRKNSIYA